jgi:hypothetical protein
MLPLAKSQKQRWASTLAKIFKFEIFKKRDDREVKLTTLTFGKVVVEGTIFFYIENLKVDP